MFGRENWRRYSQATPRQERAPQTFITHLTKKQRSFAEPTFPIAVRFVFKKSVCVLLFCFRRVHLFSVLSVAWARCSQCIGTWSLVQTFAVRPRWTLEWRPATFHHMNEWTSIPNRGNVSEANRRSWCNLAMIGHRGNFLQGEIFHGCLFSIRYKSSRRHQSACYR